MESMSHRLPAVVLVLVCLVSSCRDYKLISVGTMSDIYADMLVADQWLADNPRMKTKADTSRVYGAVFAEYGYSFKDFDGSVRHYLAKPEKYMKIVERTYEKLNRKHRQLEEVQKIMAEHDAILEKISGMEPVVFCPDSFDFRKYTNPILFPAPDTVAVEADTLMLQLDSLVSKRDSSSFERVKPDFHGFLMQ